MSPDHELSGPEKKLKKVNAELLKSTIMSKWELEAILQLLQVVERSISLKNFQKSTIQGPYQKSKLKAQNILTIINNFFQNTFSNLKPVGEPARHIQRSLHCECNIFATMAGITKWLGNTIHRIQQRPVINCHFGLAKIVRLRGLCDYPSMAHQ